jgi:hypothetical protein
VNIMFRLFEQKAIYRALFKFCIRSTNLFLFVRRIHWNCVSTVFLFFFFLFFFFLMLCILFGPVTGNSWRTTSDIGAYFESWVNNIDEKYFSYFLFSILSD